MSNQKYMFSVVFMREQPNAKLGRNETDYFHIVIINFDNIFVSGNGRLGDLRFIVIPLAEAF